MNHFHRGRRAFHSPRPKPFVNDLDITDYMPAGDTSKLLKSTPPVPVQLAYVAQDPHQVALQNGHSLASAPGLIPETGIVASADAFAANHPEPPSANTESSLGSPADARSEQPAAKAKRKKRRPKPAAKPKSKPKSKSKSKSTSLAQSARSAPARTPPVPKTQAEIDLSHHSRLCSVCRHPDREAIEEGFLQWRSVNRMDNEFEPKGGVSAIYRHARALGLFQKRNLNLRSALELVIEEAETILPTAEGLVKAIRAYTRINDRGEWIDVPTTHVVQVVPISAAGAHVLPSPVPRLALDIESERSQRVYREPDMLEPTVSQPLLTELASHSEPDPSA